MEKLSIIIYSGFYDKIHYALVLASAAAAMGRPVSLFFTMGACRALKKSDSNKFPAWRFLPLSEKPQYKTVNDGGMLDDQFAAKNMATFDELLQSCLQFGVKFMVCEMGLRAEEITTNSLRTDIKFEEGGVVTFLNDTSKDGTVIFI